MFLGNLGTNDFNAVPLGGGCPTFFCSPQAKALHFATAYHVLHEGQHAFWLTTPPTRGAALLKHLDRYLISEAVELCDITAQRATFHLTGDAAKSILERAIQQPLPELQLHHHCECRLSSGESVSIRSESPLGRPGFDIVGSSTAAEEIEAALTTAGAMRGTAEQYDVLRILAGTPEHGRDYDETRFVMEVGGAVDAVSYTKGCYLGQEPIVMSRDRAGHAPRSFVMWKSDTGTVPPPGTKVLHGTDDVGLVTSACLHPDGGAVALGYIRWKHREVGTDVSIDGVPARIVRTLS